MSKQNILRLSFFKPDSNTRESIPVVVARVSAGFPSPADDFIENRLDLNDFLVKNPSATFFVRVEGDSMNGAGIYNGDILVVDRSLEATSNKIVIGVVNGEFTVKRIIKKSGRLYLAPENENYKPIEITESTDFLIWGVVTHAIHTLR